MTTAMFAGTDINECAVRGSCDEKANCTNNEGSYECECKDGFQGDGYAKCTGNNLICVLFWQTESRVYALD